MTPPMIRGCIFALLASMFLICFAEDWICNVLREPAHLLIVRHEPLKSDAIFILSGGIRTDRTDLAVRLYKGEFAKQIYLCSSSNKKNLGGLLGTKRVPSGERYKAQLSKAGVNVNDISLLDCRDAVDTASELRIVAAKLGLYNMKRILLVTSASHSRRVSLVWRRVSLGIEGIVIGARDPFLEDWWTSKRGARVVFYEYAALVKELFRSLWSH